MNEDKLFLYQLQRDLIRTPEEPLVLSKMGNISSCSIMVVLDRPRKENEELKEFKLCKLCMEENRVCVFIPCGHLILCEKCGPGLGLCPMCRADVTGYVIAKWAP